MKWATDEALSVALARPPSPTMIPFKMALFPPKAVEDAHNNDMRSWRVINLIVAIDNVLYSLKDDHRVRSYVYESTAFPLTFTVYYSILRYTHSLASV